jgi:hypothetical protein
MNPGFPEEQGFDENSFVGRGARYGMSNPTQSQLKPSEEPAFVGWNTLKRPYKYKATDEEVRKQSAMAAEGRVTYLDHPTGRIRVELTHIPKLKSVNVQVHRELTLDERLHDAWYTHPFTGRKKFDETKFKYNKYEDIGRFTYSSKTGHIASVNPRHKDMPFLFDAGVAAAKDSGIIPPVDRGEVGRIDQAKRGPHMSYEEIVNVLNKPEKLDVNSGQQFNRDIIRAAQSPASEGMPKEGWLGHRMPDERTNYIYGPDRLEGLPLSHHHDTMYHVAPRGARESIRQNGLMPNATNQTGSPLARRYGVFLASRTPAVGYGDDIYEVHVPQKDLRVDAKYGAGYHYVERPILHHEFKMIFHKSDDGKSHEGNYLSCPECGIHTKTQ